MTIILVKRGHEICKGSKLSVSLKKQIYSF